MQGIGNTGWDVTYANDGTQDNKAHGITGVGVRTLREEFAAKVGMICDGSAAMTLGLPAWEDCMNFIGASGYDSAIVAMKAVNDWIGAGGNVSLLVNGNLIVSNMRS